MTQKAIITDLNRCVGCLACSTACKTVNEVPIGKFWIKVLRVGPNLAGDYQGKRPNVEMNFLPVTCQHCADAPCVSSCPTGASMKLEDGTVQVDASLCIGCQICLEACPYGVRYLNEELNIVEKCTMCEERISQGELPQCVAQCGGRARWYGDLDEGFESFVGPADPTDQDLGASYDAVHGARAKMLDYVRPFAEEEVYTLDDQGNAPQCMYILRGREWLAGSAIAMQ